MVSFGDSPRKLEGKWGSVNKEDVDSFKERIGLFVSGCSNLEVPDIETRKMDFLTFQSIEQELVFILVEQIEDSAFLIQNQNVYMLNTFNKQALTKLKLNNG